MHQLHIGFAAYAAWFFLKIHRLPHISSFEDGDRVFAHHLHTSLLD
jgi:hypothetical protein